MARQVGMTIVGCGGGLYHMMPALVNTIHCMEQDGAQVHVRLVDPDTIEDRNKYRQWDGVPGNVKVNLAGRMLSQYGIQYVEPCPNTVQEAHLAMPTDIEVVLVLVDNHLARAQVHRSLYEMKLPYPVFEITGGNTKRDGWADGCIFENGRIIGDWGLRHLGVFCEAREEMKPQAPKEVTCVAQGEAFVNQTIQSNMLTARLLIGVLSGMWFRGQIPYAFLWSTTEQGVPAPNGVRHDIVESWYDSEKVPEQRDVEEYMAGIPRLEK